MVEGREIEGPPSSGCFWQLPLVYDFKPPTILHNKKSAEFNQHLSCPKLGPAQPQLVSLFNQFVHKFNSSIP